MQTQLRRAAAAAVLLLAAGTAGAGVTVTYQDPDKFIDVPTWERDRDQLLKELSAHFAMLGKDLPPGQELKITVTDLDLAGRIDPRRRGINEFRVLKGTADWPTMQLHYTLEQDGKAIREGDEHLANMNYLGRMNRYHSGDSLRYEKQMVDEWFAGKFAAPRLGSK